ncbi:hypothetical protein DFH09DRAFT_114792 [Mycena vulgaris]|nr:hypothetical protein DFH09DRAFT_114792 [Mycena vulgaris]
MQRTTHGRASGVCGTQFAALTWRSAMENRGGETFRPIRIRAKHITMLPRSRDVRYACGPVLWAPFGSKTPHGQRWHPHSMGKALGRVPFHARSPAISTSTRRHLEPASDSRWAGLVGQGDRVVLRASFVVRLPVVEEHPTGRVLPCRWAVGLRGALRRDPTKRTHFFVSCMYVALGIIQFLR